MILWFLLTPYLLTAPFSPPSCSFESAGQAFSWLKDVFSAPPPSLEVLVVKAPLLARELALEVLQEERFSLL